MPLSFYIHIPYCVKRCGYCDFNTYTLYGYVNNNTYNIQFFDCGYLLQILQITLTTSYKQKLTYGTDSSTHCPI